MLCLYTYLKSLGDNTCTKIFILTQLPLLRIVGLHSLKRANVAMSNDVRCVTAVYHVYYHVSVVYPTLHCKCL